MPWTIAELYQMGAQNTIAALIGAGEASFADIISALERRFGAIPDGSTMAIADLRERTIAARNAAEQMSLLNPPPPQSYPINPILPDQYQYTVLASLPDPLNSGLLIQVPWKINSAVPLSLIDVLEQATQELNAGYVRPDRYNAASYADMHRRDIAFQRAVAEQYGGQAPIDIEVLGVFRRE